MKYRALYLGLIVLLAGTVSAELFQPACQSILKNDLANVIEVEDLDGDGTPNILMGTSVNGILYNYVYKGVDCTSEWTALTSGGWSFDTDGNVKSFAVADLDGDGRKQVVVNSVKSSHPGSETPSEYVRVIHDTSIEDWNFDKECGLSHSVDAADLDGTGTLNVIMGTQSKKVCVLKDDPKQREPVLWSVDTRQYPVYYVESVDLDGDGSPEVVALSHRYGDAYVYAISSDGTILWEENIEGGVYTAMLAGNLIETAADMVVVGTAEQGVVAYDGDGSLDWSYDTGNIVSSVHAVNLDGSGGVEVLVGSAPRVTALEGNGRMLWEWTEPVEGTVYSMSAYDMDGDGRMEVVVGTTKYLYLLDDDGSLIGSWKYTIEIQGLTKAYEERDANAVATYMGDLDGDGEAEVVAAWNWEQSTVRGNEYSTDVRLYEIDEDYSPETTTTTVFEETTTTESTATTLAAPPTTQPTTTTVPEEGGGGLCCLPMLPAVLALAFAVAAKLPLAAVE